MLNEFEVNESIEHWRDEEASEPLPYMPTKEWTADDRPKYDWRPHYEWIL
jgi:hypothetical protein